MTQGYTRPGPQATTATSGIARIATIDEMLAGTDQEKIATPLGVAEALAQRAGITGVEKGTWTPTVTFTTPGNLSVSYAGQTGTYTRIGDLVYIACRLSFTPTHTTASGNVRINGLPYIALSTVAQVGLPLYMGTATTFPASTTTAVVDVIENTNQATILGYGSTAAGVSWTTSQFPTATLRTFHFAGCYKASTTAGRSGTFVTVFTQGSFTPTVTFTTPGTLSVVYTVQYGAFTRVGSLVFITLRCDFTPTLGTASGDFRVAGLPFLVAGGTNENPLASVVSSSSIAFPASTTDSIGVFIAGMTQMGVRASGSGTAGANWGTTQIPNATARNIYLTGVYYTDDSNGGGAPVQIREVLNADRIYYVRTDGSNTNSGTENTAGGAFATVQGALDAVCPRLDLGNFSVTIQVGNGTYTAPTTLRSYLSAAGRIIIQGDTTTPSNVVMSLTGGSIFYTGGSSNVQGSPYTIQGFRLLGSGTFAAFNVGPSGQIYFQACDFGGGFTAHCWANNGGFLQPIGNYTVSGSATYHIYVSNGGTYRPATTVTVPVTGTPAVSQFAVASAALSILASNITFSGAATGSRYRVQTNAVVDAGAVTAKFPGNSAGTTATGGQYV
jgi:hypothetical protein